MLLVDGSSLLQQITCIDQQLAPAIVFLFDRFHTYMLWQNIMYIIYIMYVTLEASRFKTSQTGVNGRQQTTVMLDRKGGIHFGLARVEHRAFRHHKQHSRISKTLNTKSNQSECKSPKLQAKRTLSILHCSHPFWKTWPIEYDVMFRLLLAALAVTFRHRRRETRGNIWNVDSTHQCEDTGPWVVAFGQHAQVRALVRNLELEALLPEGLGVEMA